MKLFYCITMLFLTILVQAGCSKKEPAQHPPAEVKSAPVITEKSPVGQLGQIGDEVKADKTVTVSNEHNADIQGTWQCKFLSEGKSEVPSTVLAVMSLRFSEDTFMYIQNGTPVMKGTFAINEKSSPKELDLIFEGGGEKIQLPAIYEIKQLTLKLCHPQGEEGNRPTNFEVSDENCYSVFEKVEERL